MPPRQVISRITGRIMWNVYQKAPSRRKRRGRRKMTCLSTTSTHRWHRVVEVRKNPEFPHDENNGRHSTNVIKSWAGGCVARVARGYFLICLLVCCAPSVGGVDLRFRSCLVTGSCPAVHSTLHRSHFLAPACTHFNVT